MRLAWPDVARGGAMILVVLAHALQLMDAYGWQNGWLDTANLYLTAVRMPLFFTIAGVFAARAIHRSWSSLFATRLALLIYMYLLWMLIRGIWFSVVPWPLGEVPSWLAFLISPVWPTNGLWFLYALIVYIVVGKLTARAPAWVVLVPAALLSVITAAGFFPDGGNPVWNSIALYGMFFLLGARLPQLWSAIAERANLLLLVVAVLAVPASVVVFTVLPDVVQGPGRVALSTICVAACIVVASMISRSARLSAPLRYVGQRTIAIYVVHAMLLAAIVPLVPVGIVPAVVLATVLVVVGVLAPLGLYKLLAPVGGVFSLPPALTRRLAPYARR